MSNNILAILDKVDSVDGLTHQEYNHLHSSIKVAVQDAGLVADVLDRQQLLSAILLRNKHIIIDGEITQDKITIDLSYFNINPFLLNRFKIHVRLTPLVSNKNIKAPRVATTLEIKYGGNVIDYTLDDEDIQNTINNIYKAVQLLQLQYVNISLIKTINDTIIINPIA